ncbi:MAG TPA: LysR substrate-binding domain-containing protein, partial [Pseudomonadales bacterium]|nr:LysR substrate-binding domain-containing protein [Pseudomonadales bacterium]
MNLQQLRYVQATVKFNLNLTEAANALYTSQPGVSKQIRDFEEELGVEIFERKGKRFTNVTEPGREVVSVIERIMVELENLRKVADHFSMKDQGNFILATTHTQARYALPPAIKTFKESFPKVHLSLHQASPAHIAKMLVDGEADLGIATEALENHPELISFPCYEWSHVIIFPKDHPLAKLEKVEFEDLIKYPLITYEPGFTGGSHIEEAFKKNNVNADIILTAMDADVIKTYVELGMGVGIVASMA